MTTPAYAHSHESQPQPGDKWQLLAIHLQEVARRARSDAEKVGLDGDFAAVAAWAGWLHDVGKYRTEFQLMLRRLRGKGEATRHKQAGAAWAADGFRWDVALAIAGHHGGLPDPEELKSLILGTGGRDIARQVRDTAKRDCPELAETLPAWRGAQDVLKFDLWVRLLFSCLIDADWQDTGNHERLANGEPFLAEPPELTADLAQRLLLRVLAYIEERAAQCREANAGVFVAPERSVPAIRAEVLKAALAAAAQSAGLFSMTVPTGGAKTLSILAFALEHARHHGLRRIIYVAPYLSILEQNAREIRRSLNAEQESADADLVFEHHSLAEPPGGRDADESESEAAARQAQNWSAPFVITTNVQFFESLFSNKPGACRKLHNIARSVVVLDECQTLPPGVVEPTCSMLNALAQSAGTTIVLCTATQPAWTKRPDWPHGLENVREIAPPEMKLFARLQRVTVNWPQRDDPPLDWSTVAARMLDQPAALCIVNTKRAARSIFEHLREQSGRAVFHLSTAMCPAHRLAVLDQVRERLRRGKRCHLVSTQLIEAGVDVDFPLVLRELAPLEAIVQSAGRCNREGRLNGSDGSPGGRVIVFRSVEGRLPRGDRWYEAGRSTLETAFLNAGREPDICEPQDMLEYFRRLYATGTLDSRGIEGLRRRQRFRTIWEGAPDDRRLGRYRLIDDDTFPALIATWAAHRETAERLLAELRQHPTPRVFREIGRYQVNLRHYELAQFGQLITTEARGVRAWRGKYDEQLGMLPEADDLDLVV